METKQKIETEYRTAKLEAHAILNSCTTSKILIEKWPEVEPFVKTAFGDKPSPTSNLPMLNVEKINKAFDLPVEMEAA